MHVRFDQNVHTPDAVQFNLFVFAASPIAHAGHVRSSSVILFVSLREHDVPVQGVR